MSTALPLIPFAKLPRKQWKNAPVTEGGELKPRIDLSTLIPKEVHSSDEEFDEQEADEAEVASNASSEGYDLLQHLADLLPGEVVNGRKPTKTANTDHLEDLRKLPPRPQRFVMLRRAYRWVMTLRARERERRKHHILREYEKMVEEFDEMQRQIRKIALEEYAKEVRMEEYRRKQQIERNSRKKMVKSETTKFFTRDLHQRIKEASQLDFYCQFLPGWYIEGQRKLEAEAVAQEERRKEQQALVLRQEEARQHAALIELDRLKLKDDKQTSAAVEQMMIRYGILSYDKPPITNETEQVANLFQKNIQYQEKLRRGVQDKDETRLDLRLKKDIDLPALKQELRRHRFHNTRKKTKGYVNPYDVDFTETGDVRYVRAYDIAEVGALSFAAELAQGGCPMLEHLSLLNCRVRDAGFARIMQGMRLANLFSVQHLDLRGNCLTALSLDYFRDLSPSGIFSSLEILNLGDNELEDAGIDALIRIITTGNFRNVVTVALQRNAVTDRGFSKLMTVLLSVKDVQCPRLQHLGLELNVISARCKQFWAPIPTYISV